MSENNSQTNRLLQDLCNRCGGSAGSFFLADQDIPEQVGDTAKDLFGRVTIWKQQTGEMDQIDELRTKNFDAALLQNYLRRIPFDSFFLANLWAGMRPGGVLTVREQNHRFFPRIFFRGQEEERTRRYSPDDLRFRLMEAGFQEIVYEGNSGLFGQLFSPTHIFHARRPEHPYWKVVSDWGRDTRQQYLDLFRTRLLPEMRVGGTRYRLQQEVVKNKLPDQNSDKTILMFSPHPDDELVGPGGTLLKLKERNCEVHVVYVTDGRDSEGFLPCDDPSQRIEEAKRVVEKLGIRGHYPAFTADTKFSEETENREALRSLFKSIDPDVIVTPWPGDRHGDHRNVARMVAEILEKTGWSGRVFQYEIWGLMRPTHVHSISDEFEEIPPLLWKYLTGMRTENYVFRKFLLSLYRGEEGESDASLAEGLRVESARAFIDSCRE